MAEIARRLEASSVDCLVADAHPIRARYLEVRTELPDDVRDALHRVAYMEYWQMDFTRAQQRLAHHAEQQQAALLAENSIKRSEEEAQKTQEMQEQLSNRQDELQAINQEIADLRASLALKEEAAAALEATIAQLSADVVAQQKTTDEAIQTAEKMVAAAQADIGPIEDDLLVMAKLDSTLARALSAVQDFLSRAEAVDYA